MKEIVFTKLADSEIVFTWNGDSYRSDRVLEGVFRIFKNEQQVAICESVDEVLKTIGFYGSKVQEDRLRSALALMGKTTKEASPAITVPVHDKGAYLRQLHLGGYAADIEEKDGFIVFKVQDEVWSLEMVREGVWHLCKDDAFVGAITHAGALYHYFVDGQNLDPVFRLLDVIDVLAEGEPDAPFPPNLTQNDYWGLLIAMYKTRCEDHKNVKNILGIIEKDLHLSGWGTNTVQRISDIVDVLKKASVDATQNRKRMEDDMLACLRALTLLVEGIGMTDTHREKGVMVRMSIKVLNGMIERVMDTQRRGEYAVGMFNNFSMSDYAYRDLLRENQDLRRHLDMDKVNPVEDHPF